MNIKKYITPFNILLLLLFILLLIVRLWKVPELFTFNFDEEYQASLAWSLVKDFHLIWIGVSASNVGFYLGPGITYLNAFLFWLSNGDPVSLAYFSAVLGIGTTISLYYIARDLFSRKAAIISAILYGFSTLIIYYDRRFWNPTPIPIITLWMFYSLVKSEKNTRWFILTAILYGASLHVHLSLIVFLPLILFMVIRKFKKISKGTWLLGLGGYFIVTAPMLVFDFVHNFDNLLAPVHFLTRSDSTNRSIQSDVIGYHFRDVVSMLGRFWFIKFQSTLQDELQLGTHTRFTGGNTVLSLFSCVILILTTLRAYYKKDLKLIILVVSMLLFLISYILYPGVAGEYYLLGFIALFPLSVGLFLSGVRQPIPVIILTIFISANMLAIFTSKQEQFGLPIRKKLITEIMQTVKDRPYSLETYGTDTVRKYHPYGGWRYLFSVYGRQPASSFADEFFGWIFPEELNKEKPQFRVVISDTIQYASKIEPVKTFHEGIYYGYVFPINK